MKKIGNGIFRINALSARVPFDVYYNLKEYRVVVSPKGITSRFTAKSRDEIILHLYKMSEDKEAFYHCLKLDIDERKYYEEKKEEDLVKKTTQNESFNSVKKTTQDESFNLVKKENYNNKKESKSTSKISNQSGQVFLAILVIIGLYFLKQYDDSQKVTKSKPIYDFDESLKTLDFNSFKILTKNEVREIASSIKIYGDTTSSFYKTVYENVEGVCVQSRDYFHVKRCSYGIITTDRYFYFFEKNRNMKIVNELEGEKLLLVEKDFIENNKLKEIINKLLEVDSYFQFFDKNKKVYSVSGLFNTVQTDKEISYLALRKELYDNNGNKIDINYLDKNKTMLEELKKNILEVKKLITYVEKNNGSYIYPDARNIEEFKIGVEKAIRHFNYDIGQFKIFMNQSNTTLKDKNFYIEKIKETKDKIEKLQNTLKLISEYKLKI